MKTGPQSNVFDYDTGEWNQNEVIPQDFKVEKPTFSSVSVALNGESFEDQLIRLGKIAKRGTYPVRTTEETAVLATS